MNAAELPFSPAAERNRGPILAVLQSLLPPSATVLEIASGTGQHAAFFAAAMPGWTWQPTEAQTAALPAIAARGADLANLRAPLRLDVLAEPWPPLGGPFDAVFVANLLHISPWAVMPALMAGAAANLRPGGRLVLYGPWLEDGVPTAPGNQAFDADLQARDSRWGLRLVADVAAAAAVAGLSLVKRLPMPANNLTLVFRRDDGR